jgi:hypothetical protein
MLSPNTLTTVKDVAKIFQKFIGGRSIAIIIRSEPDKNLDRVRVYVLHELKLRGSLTEICLVNTYLVNPKLSRLFRASKSPKECGQGLRNGDGISATVNAIALIWFTPHVAGSLTGNGVRNVVNIKVAFKSLKGLCCGKKSDKIRSWARFRHRHP